MDQILQERWARMRLMLEKLKERAMRFGEIQLLVKTTRQTVHNYLREFQALGLVEYDDEKREYSYSGIARKSFSKHDYDIARKHSVNLLLKNEELMNLEGFYGKMTPEYVLDQIVVLDPEPEFLETSYLMQHLKSGYCRSFWIQFQKYKELMERHGYPIVPFSVDFKGVKHGYFPEMWEQFGSLPQDDREDLKSLREHLLVALYRIILEVSHGSPLDGWCDACPARKVSIQKNSS